MKTNGSPLIVAIPEGGTERRQDSLLDQTLLGETHSFSFCLSQLLSAFCSEFQFEICHYWSVGGMPCLSPRTRTRTRGPRIKTPFSVQQQSRPDEEVERWKAEKECPEVATLFKTWIHIAGFFSEGHILSRIWYPWRNRCWPCLSTSAWSELSQQWSWIFGSWRWGHKTAPDFFAYKISSNFSLQAAYCISFFALLQQFTYISSGPPESVEEEKWQVQDEEFDIEKEDDNSSELPLQKLRPAYSLLGPISKVPRPQSTSTKDRREQLSTSNKSNPDIAASFQSFANSILKLEEAKLEMHLDSEHLLVEREARQLDLQLKHTEMLLDTQLEITKLLTTQTWKWKAKTRKQDWNPMVSNWC